MGLQGAEASPAHLHPSDPDPGKNRKSRPGRGFTFLIAGQLVAKLARFVAAVILARKLSVSSYGLVNVGIAVAGVSVMAATLGLTDLGVHDVAVDPKRARWIAGRVLLARLLGVLVISLLLGVVAIAAKPSILPIAGMVALLSLATAASSEWLLRGQEKLGAVGIAEASGGFVVMAGCLLLALTQATSFLALCVFVAGEAITAGACWIGAGRTSLPRIGLSGIKQMVLRSWPIGISSVAFYAYYANIDTILLAATRSEREAGLYTAAYRLFLAANLVGIVAAYVQLPILSRAVAARNDRQARGSLRRALYFLTCYGAVVVGAAELASHEALDMLYGSRFQSMAPVLTLLSMGIIWYAVGFPAGYTLIARGQSKKLLAGSATAAILNISLNLVLIPVVGPIGAATATFVAFVAASIVWLRAHELLDERGMRMLIAIIAVTLGGFAVLLAPVTRLPIGIGTVTLALSAAGIGWRALPASSRSPMSLLR